MCFSIYSRLVHRLLNIVIWKRQREQGNCKRQTIPTQEGKNKQQWERIERIDMLRKESQKLSRLTMTRYFDIGIANKIVQSHRENETSLSQTMLPEERTSHTAYDFQRVKNKRLPH